MATRSLLFLVALAASAQTYEIRGTVTETGAGGIADVDVRVLRIEDGATKTTKTDGQGAFRVVVDQAGAYAIGGSKAGYFAAGTTLAGNAMLRISAEQTVVNLFLAREGEVAGRVLDADTREPIVGAGISIFTKQWTLGRLNLQQANREPAVTDADGRFRIGGVRSGEYIASARDRSGDVQVVAGFSKADIEKIDETFPATYWPGGDDAATAFGAQLTSGGFADVGTIFTRKVPQYRVHLTMVGSCSEDLRVSVLRRNGGPALSLGSHPCGSDLLLRGFEPGSYVVYASTDRRNGSLQSTVSGAASIEIVDKNVNIALALQPNVVIEGQLTIPDGVAAPRILPGLNARPFDLIAGAQAGADTTILWAADQRHFQLAVSPRTQSLLVRDVEGPYVKEVRYNGTPLRGSTLPINPGVGSHKLEIVMDDKFGTLAASVTDGSHGVQASVLAVKELTRVDELFFLDARATGPDGNLPAMRLAPGDYRVIAFIDTRKINEPGVLERALSTSQRVTVAPGGAQTISLRVTELR